MCSIVFLIPKSSGERPRERKAVAAEVTSLSLCRANTPSQQRARETVVARIRRGRGMRISRTAPFLNRDLATGQSAGRPIRRTAPLRELLTSHTAWRPSGPCARWPFSRTDILPDRAARGQACRGLARIGIASWKRRRAGRTEHWRTQNYLHLRAWIHLCAGTKNTKMETAEGSESTICFCAWQTLANTPACLRRHARTLRMTNYYSCQQQTCTLAPPMA